MSPSPTSPAKMLYERKSGEGKWRGEPDAGGAGRQHHTRVEVAAPPPPLTAERRRRRDSTHTETGTHIEQEMERRGGQPHVAADGPPQRQDANENTSRHAHARARASAGEVGEGKWVWAEMGNTNIGRAKTRRREYTAQRDNGKVGNVLMTARGATPGTTGLGRGGEPPSEAAGGEGGG